MRYRYILLLILGVDALILLLQTTELSISNKELHILYGDSSFLQFFINLSLKLFSNNDFALRIPMISLHLMSAILLYKTLENYILLNKDRLWVILVFVLLPGVMSSAIVVNSAGFIIFGLSLFIYLYQNFNEKYSYIVLIIYAFIDKDFLYLFFSLILFSIYSKNNRFLILNTILFLISFILYGLHIKGSPSGHFLDTIGIYATVFSPIIFIYIFYVLYKKYLLKEFDILWFIASPVLLFSLLLSFRQKIEIEHFAPYIIVALPLFAQTFISSYRVRLKMFRKTYKNIFILTFSLLVVYSLIIFFNKEFYSVIENPKKHFAYKMHIAKELAQLLKDKNIRCVETKEKMAERLKFYGIKKCKANRLQEIALETQKRGSVTVSYAQRVVYRANVTKINNR